MRRAVDTTCPPARPLPRPSVWHAVARVWHDGLSALTSLQSRPADPGFDQRCCRERATGIEPAFSAWEARKWILADLL
jgi:hypothetical protein